MKTINQMKAELLDKPSVCPDGLSYLIRMAELLHCRFTASSSQASRAADGEVLNVYSAAKNAGLFGEAWVRKPMSGMIFCKVLMACCRRIGDKTCQFEPGYSGIVELPDDDVTRNMIDLGMLSEVKSERKPCAKCGCVHPFGEHVADKEDDSPEFGPHDEDDPSWRV